MTKTGKSPPANWRLSLSTSPVLRVKVIKCPLDQANGMYLRPYPGCHLMHCPFWKRSSRCSKSIHTNQCPPEVVPDPVLVLSISAAVVDDNVCHWDQTGLLQGRQKLLQLLFAAIEALQVVQLPRQVALAHHHKSALLLILLLLNAFLARRARYVLQTSRS